LSDILPRFYEIFDESFIENFHEIFMQAKFHEILHHYFAARSAF